MFKRLVRIISAFALLSAFSAASAGAAPPEMVNLGQGSTYAVLSGASVANTVSAVGAPHTTLRGDLGVKANTAPSGFPPGVVTGATRFGPTVDQAHADLVSAYAEIAARPGGTVQAGALAGAVLTPGLYSIAAAASNTGTLTLDAEGDPDAVFVIQVNAALAFAAGSEVVLAGGAMASRVFWQVNGAGAIGAGSGFVGTLIATDAVTMGNSTLVNGRAFALNGALSLDNNQFYSAPPALSIDGGATAQTTDTTPRISGTTDVEAPATVTVAIGGQTLQATPADGVWSVSSGLLPNATYPVVVSAEDAVGNRSESTQQLTVDTQPPLIMLDGGASILTSDRFHTISGTSDVAADTVVTVTVGTQTLFALVNESGGWNVSPEAIPDGTYIVTATVEDPASNESRDSQFLKVDTAAPAIVIAGGPDVLTNDSTPEISGTSDLASGQVVTVNTANQTLIDSVGDDGKWSVAAALLNNGPHRVVVTASDQAGNQGRVEQMLTVDTILPLITINGGATATTEDSSPVIAGTSNAAPGTTVAVTVAGRTITALVQADKGWNTRVGKLDEGNWRVEATVRDPAGNAATASQVLTVTRPVVCPPRTIDIRSQFRRKGVAKIAVTAGGAGVVTLNGSKKVRRSSTTVGGNGKGTLEVRPLGKAARAFKRKGRVSFQVKLAYVPAGSCTGTSRWVKVKLVRGK